MTPSAWVSLLRKGRHLFLPFKRFRHPIQSPLIGPVQHRLEQLGPELSMARDLADAAVAPQAWLVGWVGLLGLESCLGGFFHGFEEGWVKTVWMNSQSFILGLQVARVLLRSSDQVLGEKANSLPNSLMVPWIVWGLWHLLQLMLAECLNSCPPKPFPRLVLSHGYKPSRQFLFSSGPGRKKSTCWATGLCNIKRKPEADGESGFHLLQRHHELLPLERLLAASLWAPWWDAEEEMGGRLWTCFVLEKAKAPSVWCSRF